MSWLYLTTLKIQKKDLREGGPERVSSILVQLQRGSVCVVDAVSYRDLEVFISSTPRYILSKDGITSSDLATDALKIKKAMVCGQILPGVPVWKLGNEKAFRFNKNLIKT